jgi:hypothetical protein
MGGLFTILVVAIFLGSGLAAATASATGPAPSASPAAPSHRGPVRAVSPAPIVAPSSHGAPVSPLSHWYEGGYYNGTTLAPKLAKMTLKIPDAQPASGEFYYVLLSTWDNAGSYDQIGIANDFGTWGWTWSYTSFCAGSYNYTPNQMPLQRGAMYTFTMTIAKGNVTFVVAQGSHVVGTIVGKSGGTQFSMQSFYSCSGVSYYDYTDYEEIYSTTQAMPSFDFAFTKNFVSNGTVTNWSVFGSPPSGVATSLHLNTVRVENEGFSVGFLLGGKDHATLPAGTTAYFTNITVTGWFLVGNVSLTSSGLPKGMALSFGSPKGAPTFSTSVKITLSSVARGTYDLSLTAQDSSARYTYVTLELHVL